MAGGLVGVVVLSWNRRDDTLACLASLAGVSYPELRVVVVDNGSSDGSPQAVAHAFPEVDLIRSEVNLGFAEGCNVGIRRALEQGADYVLLLNNDVEVDPGFVTALVEEADRLPLVGAVCSKVLYLDPPDLVWYAGASFDPRSGYNGRQRGYRQRDDGRFDQVVETDRACGAAMLVPRAVLEAVGLLDSDLFAYSEDTEWSLRARAAGLHLYVAPASRVWHKISGASGGESAPTTLYYNLRNTLAVCERFAPMDRLGTARRRAIVVGAHLVQALMSRHRFRGLIAVAQGYRDLEQRRFGQRRSR